jgi:rare lipoprotein A
MSRIAPATLPATLALACLISACGHHKKSARNIPPPPPAGRRSTAPSATPPAPGTIETGVASWYGHPYHGRRAADGEIYDMETLVAAHRTLPFNTWVRVYDLDNGKTIDVRIIDRGPFVDGRIIDLSHAAAQAIEMIGPGIANVRVEILQAPQPIAAGLFAVQVGAFRDRANAERTRREMEPYGVTSVVLEKGFWRVLVGRESSEDAANSLAAKIRKNSPEKKSAFVVRIDSEAT